MGSQASWLAGWRCSCKRAVRGGGRVQNKWVLSLLRMGANHSKERPQQEGVLNQMKNLLKNKPIVAAAATTTQRSTSSSVGSAPPSPRSLADTLASPQLQASFLQFLQDLDHNAGIPPTHCGRAGSLQFVLAVKQLQIQEEERIRSEDWVRFFPSENKATGLVLNNDPGLWLRCAEATKKVFQTSSLTYFMFFTFPFLQDELSEEGMQALLLAREHCVKQLSREHQQFLVQRASEKATTISKLASCCILL